LITKIKNSIITLQGRDNMIKFPTDAKYTYLRGSKIAEECEKSLELTLRKLGVFNENAPIEINNYRKGETYLDTIYTVEDSKDTIFEFYNFGLGPIDDTSNRFSRNYQLTMRRKNSNFTYKYDFHEMDYANFKQGLRMIEISAQLTENRVLRLERKLHEPTRLIIEEDSKKYMIGFFDHEKVIDKLLLEDFENIVEKALQMPKLNLENILKIIKNQKQISFAFVFKNNKILASVDFNDGEISKYEIEEPNRKTQATIGNKINRSVERIVDNHATKSSQEINAESYKLIQTDYKRLFKQL